jgi:hypothetical protein
MFDRIAVGLVTAWFLGGLWLVVQALRVPGRPAAERDGMPD